MHLNTYVTYEGQRYEIYWTTDAATHILKNYVRDQSTGVHHGLDPSIISQLLRRARFIVPLLDDKRPHLHVCLTGRAGKVYETHAYLVPEVDHRPLVVWYLLVTAATNNNTANYSPPNLIILSP